MLSLASTWHWTFLCTLSTSCPVTLLPSCLQTRHRWCRIDVWTLNSPLKTSSQVNVTSEDARSINKSWWRRRLWCCWENKLLKKVRISFAVWNVCFNVTTSVWTELFLPLTDATGPAQTLCLNVMSPKVFYSSVNICSQTNSHDLYPLSFCCLSGWVSVCHRGLWEVMMGIFHNLLTFHRL